MMTRIRYRGPLNWHNLVKSMEAFHKRSFLVPVLTAAEDPGWPADVKVLVAAYEMVKVMSDRPWSEVEHSLESWHVAIAAVDARWI